MGKEQELLDGARNGNLAVVERILNHRIKKSGPLASLRRGPGPNTQDSSGYTCLHHAALNGHKSVVSFLLQYDANPNIVDSKGSTALHLAAWTGNYDIVHIILTQSSLVPNVNLKNNDQETPLHSAAQYGHTSVVSLLLQHGSDPLVRNVKEESPLDLASQYGRYETVDVLIRTRPNLVHDLVKKHSPLHLAARNGHKNVVRLLLNAKFDVNYVTEKGTALHEAALYGKIEVVKLLLDYGIDIDLEDEQRRTVLDLLRDINTSIAKQTKRIIREHATLVSTEDDSSTVISDSSSHCISPPPGYTDTTPEHHHHLPTEKSVKSITGHSQSPTSGLTSPANSEFNFYEVPPPPPRLSLHNKRSSGPVDEVTAVGAKNVFSRSTDSILDGYSTSSSRSPSFLDYEAAPPIPPRDKLIATRVCKSSDSSYLLYEQASLPPPGSLNGSYTCGSISRKELIDHQRPDSQSSTGTWSNHSSSGHCASLSGKPVPPAKPPRKSISPMNRGLSQQAYSKSQHQLYGQGNRSSVCEYVPIIGANEGSGTMKRSASNDGEGYIEMRGGHQVSNRFSTFLGYNKDINNQPIYANAPVRIESTFSALYDEIANGSSNCTSAPVPIPSGTMGTSSKPSTLARSYNNSAPKAPTLHQRSKSEHHPRCPNYDTVKQQESVDENFMKSKRATVQIPVNYTNPYETTLMTARVTPPSADQAEKGILTVMRHLNEIAEESPKACIIGWSTSNNTKHFPSLDIDTDHFESVTHESDSSDFEFYSFSSSSEEAEHAFDEHSNDDDDESMEYKKLTRENVGTSVDESVFAVVNDRGKKVRVKLRNPANKAKLRNRSVKVDLSADGIVKEENPFAGLCRGSVQSRTSSNKTEPNTKSLRRTLKYSDSNTMDRKKKTKSVPSRLKYCKGSSETNLCNSETKPVTIEIKPIEMTVAPNKNWDTFPRLLPISPFDENKEWAEIEHIMASFGSGLEKEIVFSDDEKDTVESTISRLTCKSVRTWLLDLSLPTEYADLLIVNGYDDLKFMGPNVLEESDLKEVGISNEEHRKKILDSVKDIPEIKQLEPKKEISVEAWLASLHLTDYLPRFRENNFMDMNSVRNIWDVELNAVLEINKIGHRKRILASLGERLSLITDLGFDDLDFNKLTFDDGLLAQSDPREEESTSAKSKDCSSSDFETLTKSISEDIALRTSTLTKNPTTDASMETSKSSFCFKDDSSVDETASHRSSTQSIVSSSTPLTMQWKHSPLDLYRNKCEYKAYYLGSTLVRQLQGVQSSNESIKKLKESTKNIKKIPQVILSIDYNGVRFIDAQTNVTVCEHEIRNIHFACQDADDFKHFAYITKEHETSNHYCHVFCAQNLDLATEIILTLGQAFEIAYRLALGEGIETLNQIYHSTLVPSTPPAPPPRTSSFIATSGISSSMSSSTMSTSGHFSSSNTTSTTTNNNALSNSNKSAIPKPVSSVKTEVCNKKPVNKLKPITNLVPNESNSMMTNSLTTSNTVKPAIKSKPIPPFKPPSLVRSCPSPGGTLKRGKL